MVAVTEEESFGSGIKLNNGFDLEVNSSGDIRTVSGSDELQKDIAYAVSAFLNDSYGGPITPETGAEIRTGVRRVMLEDPRIVRINSLSVQTINADNSIRITSTIVGDDETQQDLVFTV